MNSVKKNLKKLPSKKFVTKNYIEKKLFKRNILKFETQVNNFCQNICQEKFN